MKKKDPHTEGPASATVNSKAVRHARLFAGFLHLDLTEHGGDLVVLAARNGYPIGDSVASLVPVAVAADFKRLGQNQLAIAAYRKFAVNLVERLAALCEQGLVCVNVFEYCQKSINEMLTLDAEGRNRIELILSDKVTASRPVAVSAFWNVHPVRGDG